jgi:HTH-type transcriptional regulator/antitoxin HigA
MRTIIKSEQEYDEKLKRMEEIFDAQPWSKEFEEWQLLILIINEYEAVHYDIWLPDPIDAIKVRMEELDMNTTDLWRVIGQKSRASEILNRKRKLWLKAIKRIYEELKLPYEVLMQEYSLKV